MTKQTLTLLAFAGVIAMPLYAQAGTLPLTTDEARGASYASTSSSEPSMDTSLSDAQSLQEIAPAAGEESEENMMIEKSPSHALKKMPLTTDEARSANY